MALRRLLQGSVLPRMTGRAVAPPLSTETGETVRATLFPGDGIGPEIAESVKQVNLADSCAGKEARIQEVEAKFTHCQATCNRIAQEKELLEKHNLWLDEELKAKVKNLAELRKANMDEEARMSAKIAELEREVSESSSSLRRSKERISLLKQRVSYMEKELCSTKDAAAANEQRLGAELSTVAWSSIKLVYKHFLSSLHFHFEGEQRLLLALVYCAHFGWCMSILQLRNVKN